MLGATEYTTYPYIIPAVDPGINHQPSSGLTNEQMLAEIKRWSNSQAAINNASNMKGLPFFLAAGGIFIFAPDYWKLLAIPAVFGGFMSGVSL